MDSDRWCVTKMPPDEKPQTLEEEIQAYKEAYFPPDYAAGASPAETLQHLFGMLEERRAWIVTAMERERKTHKRRMEGNNTGVFGWEKRVARLERELWLTEVPEGFEARLENLECGLFDSTVEAKSLLEKRRREFDIEERIAHIEWDLEIHYEAAAFRSAYNVIAANALSKIPLIRYDDGTETVCKEGDLIHEVKRAVETVDIILSRRDSEVKELQEKSDKLKGEYGALVEKHDELLKTLTGNESAYKTLKAERDRLAEEKGRLESDLSGKVAAYTALEAAKGKVEADLAGKVAEYEKVIAVCDKLKGRLDAEKAPEWQKKIPYAVIGLYRVVTGKDVIPQDSTPLSLVKEISEAYAAQADARGKEQRQLSDVADTLNKNLTGLYTALTGEQPATSDILLMGELVSRVAALRVEHEKQARQYSEKARQYDELAAVSRELLEKTGGEGK